MSDSGGGNGNGGGHLWYEVRRLRERCHDLADFVATHKVHIEELRDQQAKDREDIDSLKAWRIFWQAVSALSILLLGFAAWLLNMIANHVLGKAN